MLYPVHARVHHCAVLYAAATVLFACFVGACWESHRYFWGTILSLSQWVGYVSMDLWEVKIRNLASLLQRCQQANAVIISVFLGCLESYFYMDLFRWEINKLHPVLPRILRSMYLERFSSSVNSQSEQCPAFCNCCCIFCLTVCQICHGIWCASSSVLLPSLGCHKSISVPSSINTISCFWLLMKNLLNT